MIVRGVAPLPTSQTIKLELTEMLMPPKSDPERRRRMKLSRIVLFWFVVFNNMLLKLVYLVQFQVFLFALFFLVLTRLDKTCDSESVQDLDVLPA